MIKIEVPYLDQSHYYPTGCESVSTVMLLQYLGYRVSVDEFIRDYLKQDSFEERRGDLYGPDPRHCFCGSPYDAESYGCYAPVIVESLNRIFEEKAVAEKLQQQTETEKNIHYRAVDESGKTAEQLVERYVSKGMPVIFWACINMREPKTGPVWKLKETGETFTWISNEHCMLLVGADEENYYFNDPYDGHGVIGYPKSLVEDRHQAQHMQAVAVVKILENDCEKRKPGTETL